MNTLQATRLLGVLFCAIGISACLWTFWRTPELTPALARHRAELDAALRTLRKPAVGCPLLSLQLTLAAALAAITVAAASWLAAFAVLAVWVVPSALLAWLKAQRLTALEAQLDPWLLALANALRATPSLGDALSATTRIVMSPLREELEQVLSEHALGVPLDRALQATAARIESRTLGAAFLTLRIARASGGGVSACLESAAAALREMSRLDSVVRTKTAEGKGQALVISILPFPFTALLHWLDPALFAPLLQTARGHMLLAVCALLWLGAVLVARRIVRLDL